MSNNIVGALGGGSGIDVSSLVNQLVEIEKAPQQNRLNSQKETLEAQISAYGLVKSAISEFQSVLSPLSNPDTFNARSVSFPETDVITPNSLSPNAQTGTYQIEVLSVAQAQNLASGAITDTSAALGAGELSIRFGSWTSYTEAGGPVGFSVNADEDSLTVELDADDSLEDLVRKINDSDSDLQASIITTDGQSQLMLTAPSGESRQMEITVTGDANLDQFAFNEATGAGSMLQTQGGADAEIELNGLTVKRDTNDIDDVIQGLDFTLNKASPGDKFTFSISQDKATGEQAIRDFVEAYNALYETMKNLTGVKLAKDDEELEENQAGVLSTDGTAKSILSSLRKTIATAVPGISDINMLTYIGIRTNQDGTLEFVDDEGSDGKTDFERAIADGFDDIAKLFSVNTSSTNSNVAVSLGYNAGNVSAGTYELNITTEPTQAQASGNAITSLDLSAGGPHTFKFTINGTTTNELTLPDKVYASGDELASELQSLINGDSNLDAYQRIEVGYDSGSNQLTFNSREYGSDYNFSFSGVSASLTDIGLSDALVASNGTDVAGTIDGRAAFGSGDVLLPEIGDPLNGLTFTVGPGSFGTSSINFSRGLAGELDLLASTLLREKSTDENPAPIALREANINKALTGIESDQEDLDRRMDKVQSRLMAQFLAMESILAQFKTTGDSLEGMLANLPFTAQYK
ncbi:flagellar filament capping protein FliD [Marinobacterium arenosum]|uniref:flagellar filament capping protein FliD n=1 Tax=Marinobacterium arenosum TaxID=2862496 RepID=UPI001C948735|nr:flagellar filament capping protein FliD [Marinobacterium arenosum]MBY4675932.1 flagellar filament capping protein FliD [Marinobacterium arenosum]